MKESKFESQIFQIKEMQLDKSIIFNQFAAFTIDI